MDSTLKALSLVSGNPYTSTKESANLRRVSREINESNEAGYRRIFEKKNLQEAKQLFNQIKQEHAKIFPVELSDNTSNWLNELRRINPNAHLRKGDYVEKLSESDGYRTNGVYQFDGSEFFKIRDRGIDYNLFEFPKDYQNPLYFSWENIVVDNSFSNEETRATDYGEYFKILKESIQIEHITQDDLDIARSFNKNFNRIYEWSSNDYKIKYKNLVYFVYYEVTDNIRRENRKEYYGVVSSDDFIILAYVIPGNVQSFGKGKMVSGEMKYLLSFLQNKKYLK